MARGVIDTGCRVRGGRIQLGFLLGFDVGRIAAAVGGPSRRRMAAGACGRYAGWMGSPCARGRAIASLAGRTDGAGAAFAHNSAAPRAGDDDSGFGPVHPAGDAAGGSMPRLLDHRLEPDPRAWGLGTATAPAGMSRLHEADAALPAAGEEVDFAKESTPALNRGASAHRLCAARRAVPGGAGVVGGQGLADASLI